MGDAKRRGTFEERKLAAIALQKVKNEQELAKKKSLEASRTPEEKMSHHNMIHLLAAMAMTWGFSPTHIKPIRER